MSSTAEIVARRLTESANPFPTNRDWSRAAPVAFSHDWRGLNRDPQRETEVRSLWSDGALFVRFRCRYRSIDVFPDSGANGRRDGLWERDVAEVFLQPDRFGGKYYKEFEVSPNGQWLDLDISPNGLTHITSGMRCVVALDEIERTWAAELAIPMAGLMSEFDPADSWRVNCFRCEGLGPQRYYSSWQPTGTQQPNFHVPQKFGILRFEPGAPFYDSRSEA